RCHSASRYASDRHHAVSQDDQGGESVTSTRRLVVCESTDFPGDHEVPTVAPDFARFPRMSSLDATPALPDVSPSAPHLTPGDFATPSRKRMFLRALRLRCPHCGGKEVFSSFFVLKRHCPTCGLRLERGEGDYF